jgi:hypothetical protein
MSKEYQRALTDEEIKELLRPHGNVDKSFVIIDGEKHILKGHKLPDSIAGSFQGKNRKFIPGIVQAYRLRGDK